MAIEYVEIRNANRQIVGIIDTARSIIWHSVYYGVGDFEIYAQATSAHLSLLVVGNYVTRLDNDEVGIIESVSIDYDPQNGRVITAVGRFAKSILDRRYIYTLNGTRNKPTTLSGRVESAVRALVANNCISCTFDTSRNMPELQLGTLNNIPAVIVDTDDNDAEKQADCKNLLEYTDSVLEEYELSAKVLLDDATKKLKYTVFVGADRSIENTDGNEPIIFSQELDNLTGSIYTYDESAFKTSALIGGEGDGNERFFVVLAGAKTGLARREMFVDAKSVNKTVDDDELVTMFPSGRFDDIYYKIGTQIYATLKADLSTEYALTKLQEWFPSGSVSSNQFYVNGVVYGRKVYADSTNKYTLTAIGYRKMMTATDKKCDYTMTDDVYATLLRSTAKQQLASVATVESFSGTIDITNGQWQVNRDFYLGDIVTVQDDEIGKRISTRVVETLETQDENGYTIEAVYA